VEDGGTRKLYNVGSGAGNPATASLHGTVESDADKSAKGEGFLGYGDVNNAINRLGSRARSSKTADCIPMRQAN
jgi:hypothetical protein